MTFLIRRAAMRDYEQLDGLFAQADRVHRENLPQVFQEVAGRARDQEYVNVLFADDRTAMLVAESSGVVVGLLVVSIRDTPPIPLLVPRRVGRVEDLVVDRSWQRLGVGRALLLAAEEWALENGAVEVELNVYEFNQGAVGFYQSCGYETRSRLLVRDLGTRGR